MGLSEKQQVRKGKLLNRLLQEQKEIASALGRETTLHVYMTSSMYDAENPPDVLRNEERLSQEEKRAAQEKRKVSFWPSWARVSGTRRQRTVTIQAEMLEEMADFVEGHGCTWQEA